MTTVLTRQSQEPRSGSEEMEEMEELHRELLKERLAWGKVYH